MARNDEVHTCLVCHNIDCKSRGSVEIGEEIARRLSEGGSTVEVKPYLCFGACQEGPNIVLYPQGTWYMGVKAEDAEAIAGHMLGGPVVERLTARVDPALRDLILEILGSGIVQF